MTVLASEDVNYNYCHLQNQYRLAIHVQGSLEIVSGICKWGSCPIYKWNPQKEVIEFPPPPLLNDIYGGGDVQSPPLWIRFCTLFIDILTHVYIHEHCIRLYECKKNLANGGIIV